MTIICCGQASGDFRMVDVTGCNHDFSSSYAAEPPQCHHTVTPERVPIAPNRPIDTFSITSTISRDLPTMLDVSGHSEYIPFSLSCLVRGNHFRCSVASLSSRF